MATIIKTLGLGALSLAIFAASHGQANAQSPKGAGATPPQGAPGRAPTTGPSAPIPVPAHAEGSPAGTTDSEKKAAILASERWKKVENEFNQWLSVQVVFTPKQVEQMRVKLANEIKKMTADELAQFLDQWDAKLKVLLGKDANEARQWLGEYMSVIADGYRPTFLKKLGISGTGDITDLTAAQIEMKLDDMRAERMQFQTNRAFFDAGRQTQANRVQQWQQATTTSMEQSGQGTAATYGTGSGYQTPYSPRQYNWQPLPPIIPFWGW